MLSVVQAVGGLQMISQPLSHKFLQHLPYCRWMKEGSNGVLKPVEEDGRIWVSQGTLNIKKVVRSDGSKYQCIARNSIGERRIESALIVTAPLFVHLRPPYQVLSIGQEAAFNCNVTGYPVHAVSWKKDQRQIPSSSRVRLLSRDVLHISSVRREDRGMYQCFVFNDQEGAQGTGELKISDVAPTFISVFSEHNVHPGDSISLKCVCTGNPVPSVTWYLDDSIVGQSQRITAGDYASDNGHVISFLNITEILLEDSGEYQCHVTNDVGSVYHSNRLNVYGPPFVRRMKNVTAISGEDLVMRCPYGGHPIKGIRWVKAVITVAFMTFGPRCVICNRVPLRSLGMSRLRFSSTGTPTFNLGFLEGAPDDVPC
ncbi:Down syndrome cell adhesion molecule-like protein Dscam2 [Araneus ventricosus]|uniref:Down syndrome cell adhesion molecule-like protein Dscam2 n=1 Tax=Araneus ventricosus TaxID=182803 RepID=A0A4Y2EPP2_ARAVE|nr:Down syndrome cell adhesion molecule-like protein Dscam2 [Araneus ventricosus]